ncbi:MAG: flagellar biosynthesis protein FlhF [Desulfovibrionales bacterium]
MQVKTFRGPDTKSVIRKIKAELGPDAVILSTQTVRDKGERYCEATAALESPESPPALSGTGNGTVPGWQNWHQEWSRFKDHLLTLLKPQINYDCLTPRQRQVLEYLEREGTGPEALFTLWNRFRTTQESSILKILSSLVRTKPFSRVLWPQKCHAFTGPHGVGKTSTVLRLAIRHKTDAKSRICLANADMAQGKGRIFLRHYAELSGFDYRELATIEDWLALKRDQDLFDRIFIDMPGLGKEQALSTWMERSGGTLLECPCIHLCLSPLYRAEQLRMFREKYSAPGLASLIWTKLDEACNYGALVDEGILADLPISGLSFGSDLKNSWSSAKDDTLWTLILKHRFPRH